MGSRRRSTDGAGIESRDELAAEWRSRAARARWRGGPDYWHQLADRLDAREPVEVRGYLLGELLPAGVDSHATVRVEPDGGITVVHPNARATVEARYPGLRLRADSGQPPVNNSVTK